MEQEKRRIVQVNKGPKDETEVTDEEQFFFQTFF